MKTLLHPQTYRNIAYALLGLPLGTLWFSALVSGVTVAGSMLILALVGIPLLLLMWTVTRVFANIERAAATSLLQQDMPSAPWRSGLTGSPWARLKAMTADARRRRELAFLLLRFPVGIATFTVAVAAFTVPVMVAVAPIQARHEPHPFGESSIAPTLERIAGGSPWSWLLVPLGLALFVGAFHLVNAMGTASARWARAWLC
ncbi:MAG: sensor domain-containing protein [Actinobacteria bacterium]|nr:sensor domain-containing protein [Actinomycetota bacterium]